MVSRSPSGVAVGVIQDKGTRTKNQAHIYATILFWLSEDIASMSVSPQNNIMEQEKSSNQFESRFLYTIPQFDLESVTTLETHKATQMGGYGATWFIYR